MFFERPETGEVAILVHIAIESDVEQEDPQEFEELVISAGGDPAVFLTGSRKKPSPNYFIGTGKLQEIDTCREREFPTLSEFCRGQAQVSTPTRSLLTTQGDRRTAVRGDWPWPDQQFRTGSVHAGEQAVRRD